MKFDYDKLLVDIDRIAKGTPPLRISLLKLWAMADPKMDPARRLTDFKKAMPAICAELKAWADTEMPHRSFKTADDIAKYTAWVKSYRKEILAVEPEHIIAFLEPYSTPERIECTMSIHLKGEL